MMEQTLQKENFRIYCKHCKKEVENAWICKMDSIIGTRYALLCTGCQKLIGIYSSIDIIEQINISDNFFNELQIQLN
jgi:Na+-translocating ferredoxin:NAD+ oxidoreductase RNF subunit RnfB